MGHIELPKYRFHHACNLSQSHAYKPVYRHLVGVPAPVAQTNSYEQVEKICKRILRQSAKSADKNVIKSLQGRYTE